MKAIIRADASIHIGSGHIMRCLVLADELKQHGYSVTFVMRPQQGDMFDFVVKRGFTALALPATPAITPKHNADYEGWLQTSLHEELEGFFTTVIAADLMIVDHYGITCDWERQVRSHYRCPLIVIDDLMREHDANLIIDQTLARKADSYATSSVENVLTGIDFALINQGFAKWHEQQKQRLHQQTNTDIHQHRILLTMGGIDQPNATLRVLQTLQEQQTEVQLQALKERIPVTVLLSPKALHYQAVSEYCKEHTDWITHIDFTDDMAEMMQRHTIAIGAAGSTSWERACLGLPSIVVPLADNQKYICQSLVEHGLSLSVSLDDINTHLVSSLQNLMANHSIMQQRNLALCDGLGVKRVMNHISELLKATK
ncbi:UDP-2,4-diacetamido-2,4,6-trideoxy-beta-L-altropyranose hydrolase [Marinomonas agarivorans]|nr:UDP-2,4-diacetamido-2,4,6-trideoxy-beta-L-altropyranose hydrolase [Marinomonas agarivorans]